MKLVNIGFGSMVAAGRVLAIVAPDSAPIKRVIQEARDRGMLIDASYGRKTKAVNVNLRQPLFHPLHHIPRRQPRQIADRDARPAPLADRLL